MDGVNYGVTINSFNSVSLDPPLVLFSLGRYLASLEAMTGATHVAINLLSRDQQHISRQFSRSTGAEKWQGVCYTEGAGGAPLLDGALAQFQCRKHAVHDGGDHVICVVEVLDFARSDAALDPLVFFRSNYAEIAAN